MPNMSQFSSVATALHRIRRFCLTIGLYSLLFCYFSHTVSLAQSGTESSAAASGSESLVKADVAVLVIPVGEQSARIGLAYSAKVSHRRVRKEVSALAQVSGGQVSGLLISDDSVHEDDTKRYPITTGALFTLSNSAIVKDNAPNLFPYLQAFQGWTNVEILFNLPELTPYLGVRNARNEAYTVQLGRSPGVYRYMCEIRQHDGNLPPLRVDPNTTPDGTRSMQETGTSAAKERVPSPQNWSRLFIIAGLALCACAGISFLFFRRAPRNTTARTLRP